MTNKVTKRSASGLAGAAIRQPPGLVRRSSGVSGQRGAGLSSSTGPDVNASFFTNDYEDNFFDQLSGNEAAKVLADLSPEVSKEIYNLLRYANGGWEIKAVGATGRPNRQGQAYLDAFIETLSATYGSLDVVINQAIISAFVYGAFCFELVLKGGREAIDLKAIDPTNLAFEPKDDQDRGTIWVLGQLIKGKFHPITSPTVKYVPIDPFPGTPYGRSMIMPALFVGYTLLRILHDLARVIAQQGYPRLDIEIDLAALAEAMPPDAAADPDQFDQWVDTVIDEVDQVYSSLRPGDAYVHTSVVKINKAIGTMDSSISQIGTLIEAIERMVIRGLKAAPVAHGVTAGTTETHANRQWEAYITGIQSLQHLAENTLSSLFSLALQAKGIAAKAVFRFAKVRATEEYREVLTQQVTLDNAIKSYQAGFITQDEAAVMVFGKPAARATPLVSQESSGGNGQDTGTQDGEEVMRELSQAYKRYEERRVNNPITDGVEV